MGNLKTVACQASLPIVFFTILFKENVNDDRIDRKSHATPEKFPL